MPLNAQTIDPTLALVLKLGSGLFWTITYLLIVRRGQLDKRYGMPLLALCANVSWEFIFSFLIPHKAPQLYIDYVWLFFDFFILIQYFLYGRKDLPAPLSPNSFIPYFLLTLVCAFLGVLVISYEFSDKHGIYAAFGQNLLMSVLFVHFLWKRNDASGQSLYIALAKLIGTAIPSVYFYLLFPNSPLLLYLFVTIFFFDCYYTIQIYRIIKISGINPFKRM